MEKNEKIVRKALAEKYNSNEGREYEMADIQTIEKYNSKIGNVIVLGDKKEEYIEIPDTDFGESLKKNLARINGETMTAKAKKVGLPSERAIEHVKRIVDHLKKLREEVGSAQEDSADMEGGTESSQMSIEEIMAILGNLGDILDEVDPQIKAAIDMLKEILPEEKKAAKDDPDKKIIEADDDENEAFKDWLEKAQIDKEKYYPKTDPKKNIWQNPDLNGWVDKDKIRYNNLEEYIK